MDAKEREKDGFGSRKAEWKGAGSAGEEGRKCLMSSALCSRRLGKQDCIYESLGRRSHSKEGIYSHFVESSALDWSLQSACGKTGLSK